MIFAKRFGNLEFDLSPISNVRTDGIRDPHDDDSQIFKGNMEWHHDSTYMPIQAKGAVFTAHVVPKKEEKQAGQIAELLLPAIVKI